MNAELRVLLGSSKVAAAVNQALSPDNIKLPKPMSIRQRCSKNELVIKILISRESKTPIETLISTLDEFVCHTLTAIEALEKVEQRSTN